jgi:flagellar biosynthetic protein FliQ
MMSVTIKVAAPMLLAGLVIGLVVSIFQAVTQIQEQTLSFIPKIVALVAVVAIAGPWMLDTMVTWTQELWAAIPNYVGA